jgi:hypothetical protein
MQWSEDESKHYIPDTLRFSHGLVEDRHNWVLDLDQESTTVSPAGPPGFGHWVPINTWLMAKYLFMYHSETPKGELSDYSYYCIKRLQVSVSLRLVRNAPEWTYVRVILNVYKDGRFRRLVKELFKGWARAREFYDQWTSRVVDIATIPRIIDLGESSRISITDGEWLVVDVLVLNYRPTGKSRTITPVDLGLSSLSLVYTDDYIE